MRETTWLDLRSIGSNRLKIDKKMKCDFVQILMQINANEQKILIKNLFFLVNLPRKKKAISLVLFICCFLNFMHI